MPRHRIGRAEIVCPACDLTFKVKPSRLDKTAGGVLCCSIACRARLRSTPRTDPSLRFLSKINKSNGCWLWIGTLDPNGYGSFFNGARVVGAHRYSWEHYRSPIPAGVFVLHDCPGGDNPACVNPDHLFLGTQADNVADCEAKGRRAIGDRHPRAKLTADQIPGIRAAVARGTPLTVIASQHGVAPTSIAAIIRGRSWKSV